MLIRTLFAIVTLLFSFSLAGAEMYQWIDEKGVVTFKDTPPPATKKRKKVKSYSDSDFAPEPPSQPVPKTYKDKSTVRTSPQPTSPQTERFTGTVEMYVTDWCGYCKKAQSYLKSKGIPYVAYNIEQDSAARQKYQALGGRGVPLIIIGSNQMSGFSPETLEYYLNKGK